MTAAGRALLQEAREVFAHLDRAVETTRRTARGEEGRICVGVTPTAPFHPFVPQVIRGFRQSYPLVTLTLEEGLSQDLLRLQNDRIDVAFVRSRVADAQGLTVTSLFEEPMWVALPRGHSLIAKDPGALRLKQLANEPNFLSYPVAAAAGIGVWGTKARILSAM